MASQKTNKNKYLHPEVKILFVKFAVSTRSKMLIKQELNRLSISYKLAAFGAIHFSANTANSKIEEFKDNLDKIGLQCVDERYSYLLDKIIHKINEDVHHKDQLPNLSFKDITFGEKGTNRYTLLSLFSEVIGMSITQFIILQKIERIKDLLLYSDLPLIEISDMLHYKNEDLMIAQFKKHTGLTLNYFKKLKNKRNSTIYKRTKNLFLDPKHVLQPVCLDSI